MQGTSKQTRRVESIVGYVVLIKQRNKSKNNNSFGIMKKGRGYLCAPYCGINKEIVRLNPIEKVNLINPFFFHMID